MSGLPILIMEDDENVRKHIETLISATGDFKITAPNHGFPEPGESYSLILLSEGALANNPSRLETLRHQHPASPVIILGRKNPAPDHQTLLRLRDIFTYLPSDVSSEDLLLTISSAYAHHKKLKNWAIDQNRQENFQTGISTRVDGMISTNSEGKIHIINPAALEILMLPLNGWQGQAVEEVIKNTELTDAIKNSFNGDVIRITIEPTPGNIFAAHVYPSHDNGKITTLHNISSYRDLETLRKELIQTISHDLRSPLTAILGYAELIGKVGEVNARQLDFIHRVQSSVNTIAQLIDTLLALGEIETDFQAPNEKVQLADILEQSIQLIEPVIVEKSQVIQTEIEDNLPFIRGKAVWLKQMTTNLLENAHKYSPAGSTITVTAKRHGNQIILQFNDRGIGIPAEEIHYIFDKLYRASNIPLEAEGTGLGLSFVRSIVENHSGRLWVESNIKDGTTFSIVLPIIIPPNV